MLLLQFLIIINIMVWQIKDNDNDDDDDFNQQRNDLKFSSKWSKEISSKNDYNYCMVGLTYKA